MLPTHNEPISEEQLAAALNVTREKIRAERAHLLPGEVTKKGNVISWGLAAAQRVAEKFGIPWPEAEKSAPVGQPEAAAQKNMETGRMPVLREEGEELTTWSRPSSPGGPHFANTFLIRAKRASGDVVVVRVLHSSKFLQGFKFRAKKADAGNWWVLIGREPRFPGKW